MHHDDPIVQTIRRVVERELSPTRVVDVSVKESVAFDGEEILRVRIVFSPEEGQLDPAKVLGLVRHLREPMQEQGEVRFPLLSFMTPEEIDGAAA